MQTEQRGFTLIEVMVALLIFGLVVFATVEATSQTISNTGQLRSSILASYVAANLHAELRTEATWPKIGKTHGTRELANQEWAWRIEVVEAPRASKSAPEILRRVNVLVGYAADGKENQLKPVYTLTGFIGQNPAPAVSAPQALTQ